MSRQEDFIDAGIAYRMEHGKPMCIAGSNFADVERDLNRVFPFEAGCEYGYQYAVEKACEYFMRIKECDLYEDKESQANAVDDFINRFRKAMD